MANRFKQFCEKHSSNDRYNIQSIANRQKLLVESKEDIQQFCKQIAYRNKMSIKHNFAFHKPDKNSITQFRFDVDMEAKESQERPLHTEENIKKTVEVCHKLMRSHFGEIPKEDLLCAVLRKPAYVKLTGADPVVKHGFHLEFPNFYASHVDMKEVVHDINNSLINILPESYWKPDNQFVNNAWLVYGGSKKDSDLCYEVEYFLNHNLRRKSVERYDKDYVKMFWMFPTSEHDRVYRSKYYVKECDVEEEDSFLNDAQIRLDTGNITMENVMEKMIGLKESRCEQRESWYEIVCALHNTASDNGIEEKEMKEFADQWSQSTNKGNYDNYAFNSAWEQARNTNYSWKTIMKYWYKDNREQVLISEGTDQALAELIFLLFPKDIKLINDKEGFLYDRKTRLWKQAQFYEIWYHVHPKLKSIAVKYYAQICEESEGYQEEIENCNEEVRRCEEKVRRCEEELRRCEQEFDNCPRNEAKERREAIKLAKTSVKTAKSQVKIARATIKPAKEEATSATSKKKLAKSIMDKIDTDGTKKKVISCLTKYMLDTQFYDKLDQQQTMLPIDKLKVIDLTTGKTRERRQDDYFTFEAPVCLTDDRSFGKKFFMDLAKERESLAIYMATKCLYYCTGLTFDRSFDQWLGDGSNGKSSLLTILDTILSNRYVVAKKSLVVHDKRNSSGKNEPDPFAIRMKGRRLVVVNETERGDLLDTATLKNYSGNDLVEARDLFAKSTEYTKFEMTAKIVICSNFPLEFHDADQAVQDRVKYIPFDNRFKKDRQVMTDIMDNKEGKLDSIFSYMLEAGKNAILNQHIEVPFEVSDKTSGMFKTFDVIAQFIEEVCETGVDYYYNPTSLYIAYKEYCSDNGSSFIGKQGFYAEMDKRGYGRRKVRVDNSKTANMFVGIRIPMLL